MTQEENEYPKPTMSALHVIGRIHDLALSLIGLDVHEDIVESILKPIEAELTRNGVNLHESDL